MLAVYAIVNGNQEGWTSLNTLGLLAIAAALLGVFVLIESRVSSPLVPLRLFKLRNVATANVVSVLWAAAMFAWFFLAALYLQLVLGYSPLQVGLSFLPANILMGILSVAVSARLVMRFGIKPPLVVGLAGRVGRTGAVRTRAGRRQLPHRRAPEHAPAGLRRGHRLQPDPAGGDERRRSPRSRASPRASSTPPS